MERPQTDGVTPREAQAGDDLFFQAGELRAFWRILLFIGLYLPVLFGVMLLLQSAPASLQFPAMYLIGQHCAAFLVTALVLRWVERKPFSWVGLGITRSAARQAAFGLLFATAMISAVAFMEIGSGMADWHPGALSIDAGLTWIGEGAVYFLVIGFGEELLFRGYCFQALLRGTNAGVAIVLSSSVFALMHVWNPHSTLFALVNVGLAGALFGLAYIRSGALWLPIGMHWAWNFFQGPVYGFPVSGIPARSILLADARGAEWLTGGAFGPEGGALVTLVMTAGILFFLLSGAHRRWIPAEALSSTEQDPESDHA